MKVLFFNDLLLLLPYAYLAFFTLLSLAVFSSYSSTAITAVSTPWQAAYFSILGLISFSFLLLLFNFNLSSDSYFSLFLSPFLLYYSLLALAGLGFSLVVYAVYSYRSSVSSFEVPIFLVFAVLATLTIILSKDFLTAYLAIEFQALSLYVLASSKLNSSYSVEAGLKYFVLGSFASCLLLFGFSVLYGISGTLSFSQLYELSMEVDSTYQRAVLIGLSSVLIALLFKIGAAPFHLWLPDVYAGSSLPITMFFALVPKLAGWVLLLKLSLSSFLNFTNYFSFLIALSGLVSLFVGSYGALNQTSLKRLISYSAIGQTGYMLLGLSTFNFFGYSAILLYIIFYIFTLAPVFLIIAGLRLRYSDGTSLNLLRTLPFLTKFNPFLSVVFSFCFFSLAGFPPLAGFFSKLYLFYSLFLSDFYLVSFLAIFFSLVSATYYIMVVRFSLFFKEKTSYLFFYDFDRLSSYLLVISFLLALTAPFWGLNLLFVLKSSFSVSNF